MRFGYIIALFAATVVAVPHKVDNQNHRVMKDAMTTSMSMSMPMKRTATPTAEATPTSMKADSAMRAEKMMMP
ncbi:uncharacterized protein N7483_005171 [Penicillium malachiteum]|uniref:uncharacterized protein n=1 Tax=Penicillium malachiteum TaxID=1324776 RepID=UPI0025466559|nr:uncharacterized protein N7483_005171 [Penicillium malachiteum]KAJ5730663.1 hypothetical protein N7483_005171 [Penicillium malachiteum]